jgi:hypothetical protein
MKRGCCTLICQMYSFCVNNFIVVEEIQLVFTQESIYIDSVLYRMNLVGTPCFVEQFFILSSCRIRLLEEKQAYINCDKLINQKLCYEFSRCNCVLYYGLEII